MVVCGGIAVTQRMPLSVKDIVHRSPFRGGDGSLYVGARKSKLFQSGTHTGTDEETDLFATSDPIRGTTDGSLSSPHRMVVLSLMCIPRCV